MAPGSSMSERTPFERPEHRAVIDVLARLNPSFLDRAHCYFGGGTRIVLELGEYRVSNDVDFLCSDREGYRLVREAVSADTLGRLARRALPLVREIRADQYGVRTVVEVGAGNLKIEIVREGRIDLAGESVPRIPVPCLARSHCFAEKLLANADRGLDDATLCRDLVDLAFMIEGWSASDARAGMSLAESAYGASVRRLLERVVRKMRDRVFRRRCLDALGVTDRKTFGRGLRALDAV